MSAIRVSGQPNIQFIPKKASTVFTSATLVSADSTNGWVTPTTASLSTVLGISQETTASTDSDYATVRPMMVDMLGPREVVQIDVTGTLTAAMIGQYLKMSSTAGVVADAATATGTPAAGLVLLCVGYISATLGLFIVNGLQATRAAA